MGWLLRVSELGMATAGGVQFPHLVTRPLQCFYLFCFVLFFYINFKMQLKVI